MSSLTIDALKEFIKRLNLSNSEITELNIFLLNSLTFNPPVVNSPVVNPGSTTIYNNYDKDSLKGMSPPSKLLVKYNIDMSIRQFNKLAVSKNIVERKSYDNKSIGKQMIFSHIIDKRYGENFVYKKYLNCNTQPMYYEDKFLELIELLLS